MRCKKCDYALWDLRTRECPECGTPFRPSEFEFVPMSVRFCCAACGQEYYGTGPKGHLAPPSFACVRCGAAAVMDEMVLLPARGVDEARTRAVVLPWLDPGMRGMLKRWLWTVGMSLGMPGRLAGAIPGDAKVGPAVGYAALTALAFNLSAGVLVLPLMFMGAATGGAAGLLGIGLGMVLMLSVGLGAVMLGIGLWSLAAHAILAHTGPKEGGLARTAACICYSSGANVLVAAPCLGMYFAPVSWIWWAVVAAVMLRAAQRVSGVRAACAAVVPPLVAAVVLGGVMGYMMFTGMRAGMAAAQGSAMAARGPAAAQRVANGIRVYAVASGGAAPAHGLALLAEQHVFLPDLYAAGAPVGTADGLVDGVDVNRLAFLTPEARAGAVAAAAAAIGPGAPPHRIGDVVFVYGGIDVSLSSSADPGLWLVVWAPLPSSPAWGASAPGPQGSVPGPKVTVATLGGQVVSFPASSLGAFLAEQNELRAAAGLPALPDPLTVGVTP